MNGLTRNLSFDTDLVFNLWPWLGFWQIHLTDEEIKAGLQLVPSEKEVMVQNAPVMDITFSQFRAKLSGSIKCLGMCVLLYFPVSL